MFKRQAPALGDSAHRQLSTLHDGEQDWPAGARLQGRFEHSPDHSRITHSRHRTGVGYTKSVEFDVALAKGVGFNKYLELVDERLSER